MQSSNFQSSVEKTFPLLRCYWSEKLGPLYQPIGFKSEPVTSLSLHWFLVIFSFPLIGTEWRSRSRTVLQQIISKHQSMCLCNLTVVSSAILNCYAVVLLPDSRLPVLRPSSFVPRSKFQKYLFCSYITPREGSISSDLPCRQKERLKLLETTQITTWKPGNSSAIWAVVLVTGTAKGLVLEK